MIKSKFSWLQDTRAGICYIPTWLSAFSKKFRAFRKEIFFHSSYLKGTISFAVLAGTRCTCRLSSTYRVNWSWKGWFWGNGMVWIRLHEHLAGWWWASNLQPTATSHSHKATASLFPTGAGRVPRGFYTFRTVSNGTLVVMVRLVRVCPIGTKNGTAPETRHDLIVTVAGSHTPPLASQVHKMSQQLERQARQLESWSRDVSQGTLVARRRGPRSFVWISYLTVGLIAHRGPSSLTSAS